MSDAALMVLLQDKPALRHAAARTVDEGREALAQYRIEAGYLDEPGDRLSLVRTRDVREELKRLIVERGGKRV